LSRKDSNQVENLIDQLVNEFDPQAGRLTKKDLIEYGASPRAAIGIVLAAKARALLYGRKYVSKEDIQAVAYPVLRHRIILNFEAERRGMNEDDVIKVLLKA